MRADIYINFCRYQNGANDLLAGLQKFDVLR